MKLRAYYVKKYPHKIKLRVSYDKKSNDRPAWILVKGLPLGATFIGINLGKKGKKGQRIIAYKTYLPSGLFLPIDYTAKEMREYYNKFSEIYDDEIKERSHNLEAGSFLCKKLKRHSKTNVSLLDLGAGTGFLTETFFDAGFKDITLVDYSQGMLNKARKRKKLRGCKFIQADLKNLCLRKRYDVILSIFCLGSPSYFNASEFEKTLVLAKKHLKPGGIIAVLGLFDQSAFENHFKKLESGIYTLDKRKEFYADYFIGRNSQSR
jgi:ubiquinone/menaquinone biosynthesis C-methylase UbiE